MVVTSRVFAIRADVAIASDLVMLSFDVDMLGNVKFVREIMVARVVEFDVNILVKEARALELRPEATIDRVPGIGGEVTAIGLGAVMTASDFSALAPLEELAPSCSTGFACWPTTIVD